MILDPLSFAFGLGVGIILLLALALEKFVTIAKMRRAKEQELETKSPEVKQ